MDTNYEDRGSYFEREGLSFVPCLLKPEKLVHGLMSIADCVSVSPKYLYRVVDFNTLEQISREIANRSREFVSILYVNEKWGDYSNLVVAARRIEGLSIIRYPIEEYLLLLGPIKKGQIKEVYTKAKFMQRKYLDKRLEKQFSKSPQELYSALMSLIKTNMEFEGIEDHYRDWRQWKGKIFNNPEEFAWSAIRACRTFYRLNDAVDLLFGREQKSHPQLGQRKLFVGDGTKELVYLARWYFPEELLIRKIPPEERIDGRVFYIHCRETDRKDIVLIVGKKNEPDIYRVFTDREEFADLAGLQPFEARKANFIDEELVTMLNPPNS